MGVFSFSLLDLLSKVRSWVSVIPEAISKFSMASHGDHAICCKCGQLLCRKRSLSASAESNRVDQQPLYCNYCFRGRNAVLAARPQCIRASTKLSSFLSLEASWQTCCQCSYCSSPSREEDDEGRRPFSPTSVLSDDSSDIDSVSFSTHNKPFYFSSANSSPLDSPSSFVQQGSCSPGQSRKGRVDIEDLLEKISESTCAKIDSNNKSKVQNSTCQLNFKNDEIFYPPPPEDEGGWLETNYFAYSDEDDSVGESDRLFRSSSLNGDPLYAKDKFSKISKENLWLTVHGHLMALVSQLLKEEGIDTENDLDGQNWLDIVSRLALQAANFVRPNTVQGGSMDPGDHVKVKCIASGTPNESTLVKGVVCTKNVKHKHMISKHRNPRLLLWGGALECQKVPNELASLQTLLDQEINYVKMALSKIEALHPNVLIVEKSASSYVQEHIFGKKDITLVLNVKKSLLERISWCTGAQIVSSIDCVTPDKLGYCKIFRTEKVLEKFSSSKHPKKNSSTTLMFFEGCPRRLGCTVLLRGASHEELKKVKRAVQYASFAAYHLLREISFLADEGAMLPKPPIKPSVTMPEKFNEVDDCISLPVGIRNCQCSILEKSALDRSNLISDKKLRLDDTHGKFSYIIPGDFSMNTHERILVSLSSTNVETGIVCERAQLFRIKFYGSFDKPFGRYLQEDLFDETFSCQSCKKPTEAHVRCYTHQQGSLTILVRRLPSIILPGHRDGRIWMWYRCLKCEKDMDGVPPSSHRVIMSDAAWGLSFGKFLELSFSCHATTNRVASCGHSLQRDCLRFYGCRNMVASFYCAPVDIFSVCLPSALLDFTCPEWLRQEAAKVFDSINLLHDKIFDVLNATERKITASEDVALKSDIHRQIMFLKDFLKMERHGYFVLLQPVISEKMHPSQVTVDIMKLNWLKCAVLLDFYAWDHRLCLLDSSSKEKLYSGLDQKVMKFPSETNLRQWRVEVSSVDETSHNILGEVTTKSLLFSGSSPVSKFMSWHEDLILRFWCNKDISESAEGYVGSMPSQFSGGDDRSTCYDSRIKVLENSLPLMSELSDKIELRFNDSDELLVDQLNDVLEPGASGLSMEKSCNWNLMIPSRAYSFDSASQFCKHSHVNFLPGYMHLALMKSFDPAGSFTSMVEDPVRSMQRAFSFSFSNASCGLNGLLNHTPLHLFPILEKLTEGARFFLPQTILDGTVIVVYDDEPTSIISYSMSCEKYCDYIRSNLDGIEDSNIMGIRSDFTTNSEGKQSYPHSDGGSDVPQYPWGKTSYCKETHFRISFDDKYSIPSDKVKFSVTCYFAKQFHSLRKKCCPSEFDYMCSLSRCKKWNTQGGKSNVYFAKSLDERFIIKQVTKTELDSFEQFAPHYFKYMMQSINDGSPTCLAKVLGVYQVGIKHSNGMRDVKMDLLVMENVFFKRNTSRVYDLKGSLRSHHNPDKSTNNPVLLDTNLIETKPIFLGGKAKREMERAIWNDTSFLASIGVMDYSLLVGVDETQNELVIGIIDFLRQYTWDKQLETLIKSSGILGGTKTSAPTVISPLMYKRRFRKAMSNYFPTVPGD
ncbi:putative 1-phosphatidylinositol-3-phosphate 5-kinase FAB1C isoform X2 [Zingiber officinale]|uniref:putative 1-phosphatidylinositol-3-phosphate 5-kinase FAB1C isoform X2 n=1 Tax=Zingiber officinale TaxID=94328 RepID=UPI001C4B5FE3|nr:putative 1-phosphatidylinositol-3-phosphate 5-kinase FAB1C isoform X2 [Zingiber officinale]